MSNEFVLKWGIVSAGGISQDLCNVLIHSKSKYHVLRAVAARKLEDAKNFAEKFNIPDYYDSYDELFANKDVNLVYVGSINTTHRDVCLRAIAAGKNVLCEKPMSMNTKEQEEVLKAAKEKNVFFMEGIWSRFFPVTQRVKQELKNGSIGELKFFTCNFMVPIKHLDRISKPELGGGAILDIGVYAVQMACLAFDHEKPLKIAAAGHLMETGVDECSSIILTFSNQRIAQINLSTSCAPNTAVSLIGDKGIIRLPDRFNCPTECILANGERFTSELPDIKTNFPNSAGLIYEAEAVRDALSKGLTEHPEVTHDHSRLIMSIMEEAKRQLGGL